MKTSVGCLLLLVLSSLVIAQEPIESASEWRPFAYLEFSPGTKEFKSDIEGFALGTTTEDTFQSKEKSRVETLKTKDPVTGKEIVETEIVRSGTSSKTSLQVNKTSLLTINSRAREEDGKKVVEYRCKIDAIELFDIPEKEIKAAKKLSRDFVRAVERVSKGVPGRPYVSVVFGNKDRGAVVSGRYDETREALHLRIWLNGKSHDLDPSPGAYGFFTDLAKAKH
jgi:hypothetical protein